MQKNVLSIHYIRGVSSLLVVLFHFRSVLNDAYAQKDLGDILFRWGEIGVDAFFIISGFIICLSTKNKNSAKEFIIKRFFRIYPAYFLFILVSFFVSYYSSVLTSDDLLNAFFILPADYSKGGPFFGYSYLIVAWSLFYEICFYTVYVFSMSISHKYRNLICVSLIAICVFIPQIITTGAISTNPLAPVGIEGGGYLNIFTSPMMLIFAVGIVMYTLVPALKKLTSSIEEWVIKLIFHISAALFFYCFITGYNSWHGISNSVLFITPLIISAIIYEIKIGIKKISCLTFLGDISYSLYLSHTVILSLFIKFGGEFYHISSGFSRFFLLLSTSIITAYISFNLIEKPIVKICRKIIKSH